MLENNENKKEIVDLIWNVENDSSNPKWGASTNGSGTGGDTCCCGPCGCAMLITKWLCGNSN